MKNDRDTLISKEKEPYLILSRRNYKNQVRLAPENKSGVEIGSTPINLLLQFFMEERFLFMNPANRTQNTIKKKKYMMLIKVP